MVEGVESAFDDVVRVGSGAGSINHRVERAGSWWTQGSPPEAHAVGEGEDVGKFLSTVMTLSAALLTVSS
jgi:hypothetical protein